jgi:hypothetical protein
MFRVTTGDSTAKFHQPVTDDYVDISDECHCRCHRNALVRFWLTQYPTKMGCNLWLLPQWGDAKQPISAEEPIMFLLFGWSIWRSDQCWNLKRKLEKSEELTNSKPFRSWVIGVNFCQFGPSSRYGTSIYFTTCLDQCFFSSFFWYFRNFAEI